MQKQSYFVKQKRYAHQKIACGEFFSQQFACYVVKYRRP